MTLKELHIALMLFRRLSGRKRTEIPPFSGLRITFPRI